MIIKEKRLKNIVIEDKLSEEAVPKGECNGVDQQRY
jgi:hypothetical protein